MLFLIKEHIQLQEGSYPPVFELVKADTDEEALEKYLHKFDSYDDFSFIRNFISVTKYTTEIRVKEEVLLSKLHPFLKCDHPLTVLSKKVDEKIHKNCLLKTRRLQHYSKNKFDLDEFFKILEIIS